MRKMVSTPITTATVVVVLIWTGTRVDKIFLTWSEACEALGIGRSRLYELAADHSIESVKLGRSRRFVATSVQAFADRVIRDSATVARDGR